MKKISIFAIALFSFLIGFSGCRSAQSFSADRPNEAFVQFVSATKHGVVTVVIDKSITITAGVNDINQRKTKNDKTYAILPGKHSLEILNSKGEKLLVKDIFVSSQEIRIVEVP
ncbi:hypothetical protein HRQ91_10880 [Treponema parvum]|uniref:Lipoprotein n=1 Tax=Treponema parvum TaxID=138851 RepID=A0A975F5M7_9SPIR|nr:hypothetical protein [Treponema parvum]QTQ14921.1 hypothetical protein HRQ91_10880 [Treponema parvum]